MTVEVRYWEKDTWINYLKNDVLPLYQSALTIINLWKELRSITNGKLLSNIIEDKPQLEYVFAGGTAPPDKFEEASLAKTYKNLLGTSINLREYHFLKSHGKEPKIVCTISETKPLKYVEHIAVLLERAITRTSVAEWVAQEVTKIQENVKKSVNEILAKPEAFPESFVDFLNKALKLTVAYNECTRFIWHLRKIPKKYINEFYPELLKPDVFKFIQELLGLSEYIVPEVEDREIADLYTIFSYDYTVTCSYGMLYGGGSIDGIDKLTRIDGSLPEISADEYPYNTLGGCICKVNELIWGLFEKYECQEDLREVIKGEIPKPLTEWKNMVKETRRVGYFEMPYPDSYDALSRLDGWLPNIFTGQVELIKVEDRRKLFLVSRW